MHPLDREKLRRLMGEAAALAPDAPQRREVEAEIAQNGPWAEKEWLDLLREDAQMRLELQRVSIRVGMEERLLAIPNDPPRRRSARAWRWMHVAAGVVIVLAASLFGWQAWRGAQYRNCLQTLALLAVNDHLNDQHLVVETSEKSEFERKLAEYVQFEVKMPDLGQDLKLLGGRKCVLGSHPVVYSLWEGDDGKYSLFQFRPENFDLEEKLRKIVIQPTGSAAQGKICKVLAWREGKHGYALVADEGKALERIAARLP